MGFRFTKIQKAAPSHGATQKTVLDRLNSYINSNTSEPLRIINGEWKSMQDAISYQDIRSFIVRGDVDQAVVNQWTQRYSDFVLTKFQPVWQQAMDRGTKGQPLMDDLNASFHFDVNMPHIWDWIDNRSAQFVTSVTSTQVQAMRALIRQYMYDERSADDLAKVIRPCVGLTDAQSKAVVKYYDSLKEQMRKDHPRMSEASLEAKCRQKMAIYAEKLHRYRAQTIAQTEMAFAYNHGMQEAMRQAMEAGLIGQLNKRWVTALEHVCDRCLALNGTVIGFEDSWDFDLGGKYHHRHLFDGQELCPPLHPRCRCTLQYIEVSKPKPKPEEPPQEPEKPKEPEEGLPASKATDFDSLADEMSTRYRVVVDDSMRQMEFERARDVCAEVEKVIHEFPNAQFAFKRIRLRAPGEPSAYASTLPGEGVINLNPRYFSDWNDVESAMKSDIDVGYHPEGDALSVVTHECGHLLNAAVTNRSKGYVDDTVYKKFWDDAEKIVTNATKKLTWPNYTPDKVDVEVAKISEYATIDKAEALAEAVADFMHNGNNATPLSIKVWEELKRRLK